MLSTSTKSDGNIVVLASTISVITSVAVSITISNSIPTTESNRISTATSMDVTTVTSPRYPTATMVNSTGTYLLMSDGSAQIPPQINLEQYLIVAFLPMFLALVYTFPWRILDKTIREMEPFYQLQNPRGAKAQNSLSLDYSTSWIITTPVKALFRGHYFVLFSALISLAALILAPLSSETMFVSLSGDCGGNSCHATWGIYPALARTIEGVLAFIALLVFAMIIFNFRRKSGVYANPLSIAGLGTLFQNSDILQEFRAFDSRLSNSELEEILKDRVYKLVMTTDWDGWSGWGIVPLQLTSNPGGAPSFYHSKRVKYKRVDAAENPHSDFLLQPQEEDIKKSKRSVDVTERVLYFAAFVLIAGVFTIVTYYHWTSDDTGFERFMDSQGFGVRILMAVLGVLVKLLWSTIDDS